MSPETPLFGRLTLGSNRISLGRAGFATLFLRATGELHKHRVGDDVVVQIEMSRNKLPDSTTFDKASIIEHSIAAQILTDQNAESPFPGITVGRVTEVMMSPEYAAYEAICDPIKRLGLTNFAIDGARLTYELCFPDCAPYFPKWID